jgi:hypothetical protein
MSTGADATGYADARPAITNRAAPLGKVIEITQLRASEELPPLLPGEGGYRTLRMIGVPNQYEIPLARDAHACAAITGPRDTPVNIAAWRHRIC